MQPGPAPKKRLRRRFFVAARPCNHVTLGRLLSAILRFSLTGLAGNWFC